MTCKYGDFWITGAPHSEECGEVEWSADQAVDVMSLIGGDSPRVKGMGNVSDRLPVPVSLAFATPAAALGYCVALPWELPRDGTLVFEEDSLTITYTRAAFSNVQRKRRGLSLTLIYNFIVSGPPTITP